MSQETIQTPKKDYKGEQVLVVAATLADKVAKEGLTLLNSPYPLQELWTGAKFMDRGLAEEDPTYRQIIPYATIYRWHNREEQLLVYTRGKIGAESRLHGKDSLGVGGHINPEDLDGTAHYLSQTPQDALEAFQTALQRELKEELDLSKDDIDMIHPYGFIKDSSNEVGKVHLGIAYTVRTKGGKHTYEDCLLNAHWVPVHRSPEYNDRLEIWSQLILPAVQ